MKHLAGLTTGALALAAAFAGPTFADGIPERRAPVVVAPPPPPAARCAPGPWTGFYVGGNLGWAQLDGEFNDHDKFFSEQRRFEDEEDAFTAGVQSGYNLQCGNVVFGIESDINWVGFDNDDDHLGRKAFNWEEWRMEQQRFNRSRTMDWFGTVRGRVGWTNDRVMIYATGGLAYTQLEREWRGNGMHGGWAWGDSHHDSDDIQWGWTAGGGVEWLWSDRMSFKAEALWIDFEDDSSNARIQFCCKYDGYDWKKFEKNKRFEHDDSMVVVRAGLNFKFGYRAPPVYEPLK